MWWPRSAIARRCQDKRHDRGDRVSNVETTVSARCGQAHRKVNTHRRYRKPVCEGIDTRATDRLHTDCCGVHALQAWRSHGALIMYQSTSMRTCCQRVAAVKPAPKSQQHVRCTRLSAVTAPRSQYPAASTQPGGPSCETIGARLVFAHPCRLAILSAGTNHSGPP